MALIIFVIFASINFASFILKIVTIDESWVSHYMPETKVQSKEWSEIGARPPRKAKRTESKKKLM